jgi:hypothetical protein
VPYGFVDYHYGTSKAAPWRAGANENTTIEFSTDVLVEGRPLAAGKYGLLEKAGRQREADSAMKLAFPKGNVEDLYYYGRTRGQRLMSAGSGRP